MKSIRIQRWALALSAALLAGFAAQMARADGGLYKVNFVLTNQAPIYTVYYPPWIDPGYSNFVVNVTDTTITVDGAGKISGFVTADVADNAGVKSSVILNVTGSLSTKGTMPSVNMKLAGGGTSTKGTLSGVPSINLKFSGTASSQNPAAGLKGEFNGSYKPGIQGLPSQSIKHVSGTLWNVQGGALIESCILQMAVTDTTATLGGCFNLQNGTFHNEYYGTGKGSSQNKFSMTLKGTGQAKGASITIEGLSHPNNTSGGADFPAMSAKGKILGQKVNALSGSGSIVPQE